MVITTEKISEVLVIRLDGRLDAMTSGEFEKKVTPMVQESGQHVLIDFGKVDYISSAGLRAILILAKEMLKKEKRLALCSLNETIAEVFCISGFDSIMTIYPSLEEGLSFLKGN
ncbi:MAG: STAS domain-containing protein [Bacteroidota bacterium]